MIENEVIECDGGAFGCILRVRKSSETEQQDIGGLRVIYIQHTQTTWPDTPSLSEQGPAMCNALLAQAGVIARRKAQGCGRPSVPDISRNDPCA